MKIFIAGATGAVGLPLVRALATLGHQVIGMTRPGQAPDRLRELGAEVSFADAFDREAVHRAIEAAAPDVVIDQLTWLPANPADIIKAMPNDTRLHREGGTNLLAAAEKLGVRRYIMQSRGFYLETLAGGLADETARLRYDAPGEIGESTRTIGAYEDRVLASPLDGVVLRYGFFYGPGTWYRPDGAIADQARKG
ncbi:NAD-dependent epimerase/dehydratase family protein, partial [Sinorhizobium meliloti]|uniref:NAD-dependent epimerase/dehydratase family protein n=1 Tax=Rhizobium meliloti TaxID=382 RepID=UPI000FDCBDB5